VLLKRCVKFSFFKNKSMKIVSFLKRRPPTQPPIKPIIIIKRGLRDPKYTNGWGAKAHIVTMTKNGGGGGDGA
jgi:hypothetical protein